MTFSSAWILGSTSTTAKAIITELAHQGCRRFHLIARNKQRNEELAQTLRSDHSGLEVTTDSVDLASHKPIEPPESFDLYVIAAGVMGNAERARTDSDQAQWITQVNFTGLIPWLTAIVSEERIQQPGALWVFSSVAADRGRPSNYHYGAAKAGLTRFCEGLLLRCQGHPFTVRILKAGFITSPMTEGKAPPLLCTAPETIAKDLLRHPQRRGIEYIPWWWDPVMKLVRRLPAPLASKL
ncbi:SDR family NAD(P)-dependent oxidoreductase [Synechococcus sp. AH-736-G20]|nr:SDR family NAD(P)-dependent oxidoreductase [Synechococcus sp. AH-736-G20]